MINITAIRRDIDGVGEDARFLAFMTLYSSQEPESQSEIDHIICRRDPVAKLMFLRFLGHIQEERAVRFICRMMEDDNPVVGEASRRGFERNSFEKKLDVLRYSLNSPHRGAMMYAIDQLSQAGRIGILDRVLALIDGADAPLLDAILTAMRFIPDRRGVETLLAFAKDPRPKVRFRVALACVGYCQAGMDRMHPCLLHFLNDLDSDVRLAAIWGVGQLLRPGDAARLMQVSVNDPDAKVRQATIMTLGRFPSRRLVAHLLAVLVSDPDKWVAMRCESTLLNMPAALLRKGLDKMIRGMPGPLRNRAVLLSAEIQRGSADFFAFLKAALDKAGSDKERVVYLEALGIHNDPRAVPVLLKYIRGSSVVGYAAMGALIKVSPCEDPLVAYLEDPSGKDILKQMILRHFSRVEKIASAFHDRMIRVLDGFLKSDTINIRYLATQVLVRLSGLNTQDAILETLQRETEPASLGLMRSAVVGIFTKDPPAFSETLRRNRHNGCVFALLQDVMTEIVWSPSDIAAQIPKLFADDIVLENPGYILHCAAWIARQIFLGRVGLDPVIRGLDGLGCSELLLVQLSDALRQYPLLQLSISGDWLSRKLTVGSIGTRKTVIDLMGISRDPDTIPALVDILCNDAMGPLHLDARQSLARVMGDAAVMGDSS